MNRIFLDVTTDGVHSGQSGRGSHHRSDDPVLHRPQVGSAFLRRGQSVSFRSEVDLTSLPTRLIGFRQLGRIERREIHRPHQYLTQTGSDR